MKITLKWVPHDQWPQLPKNPARFNLWMSHSYIVQGFHEKDGVVRLAVGRNPKNSDRHADSIGWDELQAVKAACSYGNFEAIEIFPPEDDAQPAGGMRHLWIFPKTMRLAQTWRKSGHQMSLLRDMLAGNSDEEKGS